MIHQRIEFATEPFPRRVVERQKLEEADGRVVLVGLSKELKRLFEMTALDRLFQFAPSTNDGLGVFGVATNG